jgi:hypothetical protein
MRVSCEIIHHFIRVKCACSLCIRTWDTAHTRCCYIHKWAEYIREVATSALSTYRHGHSQIDLFKVTVTLFFSRSQSHRPFQGHSHIPVVLSKATVKLTFSRSQSHCSFQGHSHIVLFKVTVTLFFSRSKLRAHNKEFKYLTKKESPSFRPAHMHIPTPSMMLLKTRCHL